MKVNIKAFMKTPPPPPALGQPNNPSTKPVYLDLVKSKDSAVIVKHWGDHITAGFLVDILRALPRPHEDVQRIEDFTAKLYAYKEATLTDLELDEGLIIAVVNKSR